ncbi:MAG: hypothetical protein PUD92_08080 [Clostridiales bacterium]|nr:hypothetical protein [Clostridiales bacterium]
MKQLLTNPRNILAIAAYVCLTAAIFAVGIGIGYHNGKGLMTMQASVTATGIPDGTPAPAASETPPRYRVILEDGELRLYLDENGASRLISNNEISEASFPASDVAELKEGIHFDTLSDALALMENFLS